MRLEKASWHNMGPFGDWTLDLTALDPGAKVVALTGVNGRGKSYCMESAVPGACWRKKDMPTQGTVASRATAADSWQESTLVHAGHRYTIKHLVNAANAKRTGEALVTENGKPLYEGTGINQFEAWAARNLPDPDVLFASLFAAQQSEGFVKMTSGERIGIILRVIGVARFERMAELARRRRDAEAEKLDALVKRIADIRGDGLTVEQCEAQLAAARETVASFEASVAERSAALESARQVDAAVQVQQVQRDAAIRERAALCERADQLRAKRLPVAERVRNNKAVLADADAIRRAVTEVERLQAELAETTAAVAAAEAEVQAAMAPWRDVNDRIQQALHRALRAATRAQHLAAAEAAQLALPKLRHAVAECEAEVAQLTADVEELQGARIAGADERIEKLRDGLVQVTRLEGPLSAAVDVASDTLNLDDQLLAAATQGPGVLRVAKARLASARVALSEWQSSLASGEQAAARLTDAQAATAEHAEATAEEARLVEGYAAAGAEARSKRDAVAALQRKATDLRDALVHHQMLAAKAAPLANAETRLAELEPVLAALNTELVATEEAIAALPAIPEEPTRPDLKHLAGQLERAEALLRFEREGIVRLEQQLAAAQAVDAKVVELESERAAVEAELGVCTRLALDLGRTGLQSAEVDSAGPELTELVNDLLRTCHGPRFTVSVDTQRLTADGKKTVDECLISVIDTEKGTEKEVREHSGGERVILGEAISLALTMLACRRAGFERPTLFRDESAAALDPANARAWVAMMRRAVELTGADRLLFVSHSPEVVEMADAQIPVGEPAAALAEVA